MKDPREDRYEEEDSDAFRFWCDWQLRYIDSNKFCQDFVTAMRSHVTTGEAAKFITGALELAIEAKNYSVKDSEEALRLVSNQPLVLFRFYNGTRLGLTPDALLKPSTSPSTPTFNTPQPQRPASPPRRPSSPPLSMNPHFQAPLPKGGVPTEMKPPGPMGAYTAAPFASVGEDHVRGFKSGSPYLSTTLSLPHLMGTVDNNVKNLIYGIQSMVSVFQTHEFDSKQSTCLGVFFVRPDSLEIKWAAMPAMQEREVLFKGAKMWETELFSLPNPFFAGYRFTPPIEDPKFGPAKVPPVLYRVAMPGTEEMKALRAACKLVFY